MKYNKGHFVTKKDNKGKSIVIEGLANKAVADRVNEVIPPEAWELENFAKNPIIFYNHDRNLPIGKAIDFKVTDEGLKIKVRLSRSNTHQIAMVRDLVEEGILSTFSVGFDDHDTAEKSGDGSVSFKRAELLETSVVSIPMNQDSIFQVVGEKSKAGRVYRMKKAEMPTIEEIKHMEYDEFKQEVLCEKGAWLAAAVHSAMHEGQKGGRKRDDMLNDIVLEGDLDPDFVRDILAGEVTPAPEAFLDAAAKVLEIDKDSLVRLNQGKAEEEDTEEEEEKPDEDEDDKQEDMEDEEDKQEDEDEDEEKVQAEKDFQECVASKIPKLVDEGMERDQAIAAAISQCQDAKGCTIELTDKHYETFMGIADGDVRKAEDNDGEEEEEDKEESEKQADQGDANGPTTPIDTKEDPTDLGQPGLDMQKAQIALAGESVNLMKAMVIELQKISSFMSDKQGEAEVEDEEEPEEEKREPMADEDEEEEKSSLVKIEKNMDEIERLNKRLAQLNEVSYDLD